MITIRKHDKNIPLQLLSSEYNDQILDVCFNYHFDLDLQHTAVTKSIIDEIHDHNLLINVWTVNNPVIAEKLISCGVDFITTDILE